MRTERCGRRADPPWRRSTSSNPSAARRPVICRSSSFRSTGVPKNPEKRKCGADFPHTTTLRAQPLQPVAVRKASRGAALPSRASNHASPCVRGVRLPLFGTPPEPGVLVRVARLSLVLLSLVASACGGRSPNLETAPRRERDYIRITEIQEAAQQGISNVFDLVVKAHPEWLRTVS